MADIVTVENRSSEDFRGAYNSKSFVVPAGKKTIIDREAAVIWFGDWNTRNVGSDPRTQYRARELERLKGLYGALFDDPLEDPRIPDPLRGEQKWAANKPNVALYEADGKAIVSVIEDPAGEGLPLEDAPAEDLAAAMATLQAQVAEMQSKLIAAQEAQATNQIPEDTPEDAPRRRRGPVTVDASREE